MDPFIEAMRRAVR